MSDAPSLPWFDIFDTLVLALDADGIIQQAQGHLPDLPTISAAKLPGLHWDAFVAEHAAAPMRAGLRSVWRAVSDGWVDANCLPEYVPVNGPVVARLVKLARSDYPVGVRLFAATANILATPVEAGILPATSRMLRLSQQVLRGVNGPLTDAQVRAVGDIVDTAAHVQMSIEVLQSLLLLPLRSAPLPQPLAELVQFRETDFNVRRITTQRLTLAYVPDADRFGATGVYCYVQVRSIIKRILELLWSGIAVESAIHVQQEEPLPHVATQNYAATENQDTTALVQVSIAFAPHELELQVERDFAPQPLDTLPDSTAPGITALARLVTVLNGCLSPLGCRAWIDAPGRASDMPHIRFTIPRWQGDDLST